MANLSNINDKLVVTDAGNVGIGDLHTSIDAPLTIQAGLDARAIRIRGRYLDQISELDFYRFDNSTILARIESLSDSFNINTYPSNPITFKTANVEKMRISSSGNVGIGLPSSSPSPSAKLQVYSTAATNIFMTGYGTATQNNWGAQNVMFVGTDNGLLISKENAANNTNRLFNFYNNANYEASLYMYKGDATAQVLLNTNGNSYFLGGSIGIGATDPIVTAWGNTTNTRQLTLVGSAYAVINLQGSNNSLTQYSMGVGDGRFYMAYDRQAVKHRLVVDSTGYVGIGTSNPAQNFVVAEATDQHGIELVPGTLSYIQAYDRATSDYGDLHIDAQKIGFGLDNGAEKVTFLANGNVGIGTPSPADKLTVNGNIITQGGSTNTGYDRYLKLYGNTAPATNTHRWAGLAVYNNGGNNVNELAFFTGSGDFARTEKMRITSGGQVNIYPINDTSEAFRVFRGTGAYASQSISLDAKGGDANIRLLATDTSRSTIFYRSVDGGGSFTESMRINNSGNVGIKATSPAGRLTVEGPVGAAAYNASNGGIKNERMQMAWYTGQFYGNNTAYTHIKTNLWMGGAPSGNTMYIMGGFTAKSYSYSSNGYGEGSCMFHNWSGSFPNLSVTNRGSWATFMQSPYTSSDGYCVIVLRHDYYSTPQIDFFQEFTGYPWRAVSVTAQGQSSSNTGLY